MTQCHHSKWFNKVCIQTSVLKTDEVPTYATTWMGLEVKRKRQGTTKDIKMSSYQQVGVGGDDTGGVREEGEEE